MSFATFRANKNNLHPRHSGSSQRPGVVQYTLAAARALYVFFSRPSAGKAKEEANGRAKAVKILFLPRKTALTACAAGSSVGCPRTLQRLCVATPDCRVQCPPRLRYKAPEQNLAKTRRAHTNIHPNTPRDESPDPGRPGRAAFLVVFMWELLHFFFCTFLHFFAFFAFAFSVLPICIFSPPLHMGVL